jgi:hypothetical protein
MIDDGVRATVCALEIYEALQAVHAEASIGMATGMVYCGEAGSSQRCEYTAVGFKVIMAARLMQVYYSIYSSPSIIVIFCLWHEKAASKGEGILCDEEIWKSARDQVDFRTLPPIPLKGVEKPVAIYRPVALKAKAPVKRPLASKRGSQRDIHNNNNDEKKENNNVTANGDHNSGTTPPINPTPITTATSTGTAGVDNDSKESKLPLSPPISERSLAHGRKASLVLGLISPVSLSHITSDPMMH